MRIQDFGLTVGIFLVCIALGLYFGINNGYVDISKTIPYIQYSPYVTGGIGFILSIISLVSLAKIRKD